MAVMDRMMDRLHRLPLWALAALAVALRMAAYGAIALPFGGLTQAMCQYDCGWYARLAAQGYGADTDWGTLGPVPNWAFFPLYPILLRGVMAVTHWAPEAAGLLLSNALFLGFILLSCRYLRLTRPGLDLRLWVVFAVLFPFGFIFSAVYSESLFALLTVAVMLALRQRRVLLAALLTALLCATRPTGILMVPLIAVERARFLWLGRHRQDRLALLGEALLPVATAPLGLSLYMAYQYAVMGDALAFNHVQILWDRAWLGPVELLWRGFAAWDWMKLLSPNGPPSQSYDAGWAVLGLGVAAFLAWRRRWAEAWLLAASVLLPLSSALHSLPRFVATNPFFLFVGAGAVQRLSRHLRWDVTFGTGAAVQAVVIAGWFIASNALY